ncbi:MAG TPA: DsrE family protein [Thiobacillaceae bacterium]|nr:DsrE family protein [Thiobacillaceae bacterium]
MKAILATVAIFFMMLASPPMSLAADETANKVVIQVSDNDPAKWNLALNNAKNIQEELGKANVKIEIVAYGPGINMLKFDSQVGNRLAEATNNGVFIAACANTMKAQKLAPEDMHPAAKIVPAGVVEIIKREREGYAYIRP